MGPHDAERRGSPPPARRGPRSSAPLPGRWRFTSACAERTARVHAGVPHFPVHLRLRGEDAKARFAQGVLDGSPPPARRGLLRDGELLAPRRFTSACAERTPRPGSRKVSSTVHLRLRGEDGPPRRRVSRAFGSPPPARRGRSLRVLSRADGGFTSACAERTATITSTWVGPTVHLRLRGEDWSTICMYPSSTGSPPPARRGLSTPFLTQCPCRFTSACAERTPVAHESHAEHTVHLRLRGEDGSSTT